MHSLRLHILKKPQFLLLQMLVGGMLLLPGISQAQGTQAAEDSSLYMKIEQYKGEAQSLVYFIEYMFNVLGDPEASTAEKDVIIQESYLKVFRDAKVQIEDDLVPNRKVVTNKDIPAYLKDITFFFKSFEVG